MPEGREETISQNIHTPLLPVIPAPLPGWLLTMAKSGNRYIQTYMCLGSYYPKTIPFRVDALTVAESMVEIFFWIGIQAEILTDQTSVFMGKVTQELGQMHDIIFLNTSLYHPPN